MKKVWLLLASYFFISIQSKEPTDKKGLLQFDAGKSKEPTDKKMVALILQRRDFHSIIGAKCFGHPHSITLSFNEVAVENI